MNSLNDLAQHFLKDMYYAEQQSLRFVPEMVRAAQSAALRAGFHNFRELRIHTGAAC